MTKAADPILSTDACRRLMPGAYVPPEPVAAATEPMRDGLELALLLGNLCAALQRVKTDAGSGDMDFIRSVRGRRVEKLTADEITRLMVVRWKYRFSLPDGLRPISPPG